MHDYAQLLHMHTVRVYDSNFLCSIGLLFGKKLVLYKLMLMMNFMADKKYVHVCMCVFMCHTTQRAQRGFILPTL